MALKRQNTEKQVALLGIEFVICYLQLGFVEPELYNIRQSTFLRCLSVARIDDQ